MKTTVLQPLPIKMVAYNMHHSDTNEHAIQVQYQRIIYVIIIPDEVWQNMSINLENLIMQDDWGIKILTAILAVIMFRTKNK